MCTNAHYKKVSLTRKDSSLNHHSDAARDDGAKRAFYFVLTEVSKKANCFQRKKKAPKGRFLNNSKTITFRFCYTDAVLHQYITDEDDQFSVQVGLTFHANVIDGVRSL
jgi:hypothetical protein